MIPASCTHFSELLQKQVLNNDLKINFERTQSPEVSKELQAISCQGLQKFKWSEIFQGTTYPTGTDLRVAALKSSNPAPELTRT